MTEETETVQALQSISDGKFYNETVPFFEMERGFKFKKDIERKTLEQLITCIYFDEYENEVWGIEYFQPASQEQKIFDIQCIQECPHEFFTAKYWSWCTIMSFLPVKRATVKSFLENHYMFLEKSWDLEMAIDNVVFTLRKENVIETDERGAYKRKE